MRTAVMAGWSVVALIFVACEVVSLATGRRYAGLQEVFDLLAGRSRRRLVLLFLGWMWVGWHFFAR